MRDAYQTLIRHLSIAFNQYPQESLRKKTGKTK